MSYLRIFEDGIFCSAECRATWESRGYGLMEEQEPDIQAEYQSRRECANCGTGKPWGEPYVYLLGKPGEQLLSYLGFGFRICDDDQGAAAILEGPEVHGEWQIMRLASGLQSASWEKHPSYEAAKAEQKLLQELEQSRLSRGY